MSTQAQKTPPEITAKKDGNKPKYSIGIIASIVVLCAVISLFYGASFYKSATQHAIELVNGRSKQFEVVFNELLKARLRAMGIAADTLLQSKVTIEPFAKRNRSALGDRVDGYFAFLQKKHGVEQLNFWIPQATMFYRAGSPELGQFDAAKFRKSIVAAMERKDRIMTVEAGQGGVVGVRAIVPVTWNEDFVGLVEYVSSFRLPLEGAAQESEFKWALGLNKDRLTQVERPKNDAIDVPMGDDVFIEYSDKSLQEAMKKMSFDSRGKEYQIVDANDRSYFVKTIPVFNFSGVPTITIAMVDDISATYSSALKSSILRGLAVFVVLVIALLFIYYKIDHFRAGILGSIGAEKRLLQERLAHGDAAIKKLNDMNFVKRQNFYKLMLAINKPLLGIKGRLSSIVVDIKNINQDLKGRIQFVEDEASRLQNYVTDFLQIEHFRQGIVDVEMQRVSIQDVIEKALVSQDLAERFPLISVKLDLPANLPKTKANAGLLERAFINIISYATSGNGRGDLLISAAAGDQGYLSIVITGSVMAGIAAPTDSILDESSVFLSGIDSGVAPNARMDKLTGIFLAKLIFEFYGGSLTATTSGEPGFIAHLAGTI